MISDCVPPHIQTRFMLRDLSEATTLRQVYSLPIPSPVHGLENDGTLDNFPGRGSYHLQIKISGEKRDVSGAGDKTLPPELHHAVDFIEKYETQTLPQDSKTLSFLFHSANNGMAKHIVQRPHIDGATMPNMRVYFYASSDPTFIVPHRKMLSFLDNDLLDMNFDDKDFHLRFANTMADLCGVFARIAEPMPVRGLNVISGATVHFMPRHIADDRHFLRVHAFGQ